MSASKRRFNTFLIVVFTLLGLSLLLYPTVSNYWNETHRSQAKSDYIEKVTALDESSKQALWDEAVAYNSMLLESYHGTFTEKLPDYYSVLNVTDEGTMSIIHIPKIKVHIPVRHGTSDATLQNYIGHMPESSLPVGGPGTHSVFVGHRGLPSSVLFSELDALAVGDRFVVETLGVKLGYEVDQVLTVLPDDLEALAIQDESDLCTLVTCTPYGVNTHRLLVRGHRVEMADDEVESATQDTSPWDDPMFIMIGIGAVIVVIFVIIAKTGKKKKREV